MKKVIFYLIAAVLVYKADGSRSPQKPVNVYYPDVKKIQQPFTNSCWAAALTMLYSYKMQVQNLTILDVLNRFGQPYLDIYNHNTGIDPTNEANLYQAVPLTVITGQNPTIAAWADILQKHGPLSVTVAAPNYHALVVTGFNGDGTSDNTTVYYIDPADGTEHQTSFTNFLTLYEGAANWPLQIIYWPDINPAAVKRKS